MNKPSSIPRRSKLCRALLCFIDSFLSIAIFSPLVVGYWRGCWQLMDHYLIPKNKFHSLWASFAIGVSCSFVFCLLQNFFNRSLCKKGFSPAFLIVSRSYTIIYCLSCVNHWRGVWMAWDNYTGTSWESGAASAGVGLLALGVTRGLRNILAPPFVALPDHKEHYFYIPTLFKAKSEQCCYYLLDLLFTTVVTASLVVFVWRGTWIFLDRKLFPRNAIYSAWGSLVIGLTVSVLAFFAQIVMVSCLRGIKKGVCKTLLEDAYHTFCFVGAVNVWRGVWNLLNIYLYPDKPILSNMITTIGGNLILMLFFCANSTIPVKGAEMDGTKEGAHGIVFKTTYLRSFFKPKDEVQNRRYDFWENNQTLSVDPSGYIDVSKSNGLLDGRGMGDGNSYTDGCNGESPSEDEKQLFSATNNEDMNLPINLETTEFNHSQRESYI